jgi:hypothetical protein
MTQLWRDLVLIDLATWGALDHLKKDFPGWEVRLITDRPRLRWIGERSWDDGGATIYIEKYSSDDLRARMAQENVTIAKLEQQP